MRKPRLVEDNRPTSVPREKIEAAVEALFAEKGDEIRERIAQRVKELNAEKRKAKAAKKAKAKR